MNLNRELLVRAKEVFAETGDLETTIKEYVEGELRATGFTAIAYDLPRSDDGLRMMAAWLNVRIDQLPYGARFHPNTSTMAAWGRVAAVKLGADK